MYHDIPFLLYICFLFTVVRHFPPAGWNSSLALMDGPCAHFLPSLFCSGKIDEWIKTREEWGLGQSRWLQRRQRTWQISCGVGGVGWGALACPGTISTNIRGELTAYWTSWDQTWAVSLNSVLRQCFQTCTEVYFRKVKTKQAAQTSTGWIITILKWFFVRFWKTCLSCFLNYQTLREK